MTKNIIFPVNNKGGVGKTSILTDLSSALAQRHSVGIIDTDHQASLAGTLLGHGDLFCRELSYYDNMPVRDVTLMKSARFNFDNGLSSMGLEVEETKAKLGIFPIGILYESPDGRDKLEVMVNQEMKDVSFLAVDLPPIPHPSLILDHTIMPLVELLQGDVNLFPLLVSTPEHNVIDIALRQYSLIAEYFEKKGISKEKIFPISVLNKVPLGVSIEDGKTVFERHIDESISEKLGELGILYLPPHWGTSGINHFNRKFDFNGEKFRSVAFPFLDYIEDGRFSLLWGEKPDLHHYPYLVELVKGNKFDVEVYAKPIETVYLYALGQLVNHITAKSGEKPHKNYLKKNVTFDVQELTSEAVKQLRYCLKEYYEEDGAKPETELITVPLGGASGEIWYELPKTVSLEQITDVIVKTQKILTPSCPTTYDRVLNGLKLGDSCMDDSEYKIKDEKNDLLVGVSYECCNQNKFRLAFQRAIGDYEYRKDRDMVKYLQNVEIFLQQLDKVFEPSKAI